MSCFNSEAIAIIALRHGVKRREIRVRQTQRRRRWQTEGGGGEAVQHSSSFPSSRQGLGFTADERRD